MIELLKAIERNEMLGFLKDADRWKTVDVDYHHPRVERVWMQLGEYRLSLHTIHPCTTFESLYHHHTWPAAMHVLEGKYEMGLGIESESGTATFLRFESRGDMYYEMLEEMAMHYVRPIGNISYSVMLSGEPWDLDNPPKSNKELGPLSNERKTELLQKYIEFYENVSR